MSKIRILEIVPSLTKANGIASFVINYTKGIDKNKFDITFCVVRNRNNKEAYEGARKAGAKIVELYLDGNYLRYHKMVNQYLAQNRYDVVHCNMPNIAFVFLRAAKRNNVPVRIIHSHATKTSDRFLRRIRNWFLIKASEPYVTQRFACSELAGKSLFGRKNFTVINNVIDYGDYAYNIATRRKIRKSLGIKDDEILIGNVGRYSKAKNQEYIIDIMRILKQADKKYKCILIGGGIEEEKLSRKIKEYGLDGCVKNLGLRKDVKDLYNAMDVFLLPSLFEGFPVVGIEAQVNGLPCIFSKTITKEAKLLPSTIYLSIGDKNINKWANCIVGIKSRIKQVPSNKFDATSQTFVFQKNIEKLVGEAK